MTYVVELYPDCDYELPDEPATSASFGRFVPAVAHLIETATTRYNARKLRVRRGDDPDQHESFPFNALALYEPGQPGNVVLREVADE